MIGRAALILAIMAGVIWIRTRPLALPETDNRADTFLRQQVREMVAPEVMQKFPPDQWETRIESAIADWIAKNHDQFDIKRAIVSDEFKSLLKHTGEDGREYVYLGDLDSYAWLRTARNYLRHGTTCDAIVDGQCRDTYADAPWGAEMKYDWSLHIAAIAQLQRLITWFHPGYPLSATAFWIPVLLGAIGVLPAFFIGRRFAGDLGGLCAAVLTALYPPLLIRSIGSDNDIWNAVLPLFTMWMAFAALETPDRRRQVGCSLLAAAFAGMHSATWRGWIFIYVVVLAGSAASIAFDAVRYAVRQRSVAVWRSESIRRTLLVAAVFAVVAGALPPLIGVQGSSLQMLVDLAHKVEGGAHRAATNVDLWPNLFQIVAELEVPTPQQILHSVGGPVIFSLGFFGLPLLLLPKRRWRLVHGAVILLAIGAVAYWLTSAQLHRSIAMMLLSLPVAAALLVDLVETRTADSETSTALITAVWFLGAVFNTFGGIRFELLMGPPVGIAAAVTVGRLYQWGRAALRRWNARLGAAASPALFALLACVLIQPVRRGYATASAYIPEMNDAWWDTLVKIRKESPADAIVNTWWDYGYWVKYVAERRVSADGGTLRTHVVPWLAKALLTPNERESIGILRMLNCGSETTPDSEDRTSAFGKLLKHFGDPVLAYSMVLDLVQLDAPRARAYLAERGLTAREQDDVLESTHCQPPASYLILSGEQLMAPDDWMRLGMWDLRRSYAAHLIMRRDPRPEAIAAIEKRLGYSKEQATALYDAAQTPPERVLDIPALVPPHRRNTNWFPCHPSGDGTRLLCRIGLALADQGVVLDGFVYDGVTPANTGLRYHPIGKSGASNVTAGTPGAIITAAAVRGEFDPPSPTFPNLGAVVDVTNHRVLLGTPALVRSTFFELLYLDGRDSTYFEKTDDRSVGYRVVTWKERWKD